MSFGEIAEGLLALAADTSTGEHDDPHGALLEALRAWSDANDDPDRHDDERHDCDVRMVAFLLAAIDAAEMPAHDSGLAWVADVVTQLAAGQRVCGNAWRDLSTGYVLDRLASFTADYG